jgi:hypothetical protein
MAEQNIGSVSVSVVPDARAFWARFQEQTRGDAEDAGRRQGVQFRRGFDETGTPSASVLTWIRHVPARRWRRCRTPRAASSRR